MTDAQLKRSLTLPLLTLYGLGTILGAGIYVLVGKVAGVSGFYAPIAFLVSAIIAAFTGYSYAQLCTRFPRSAGEAVYVNHAFGWPQLSATVGWMVILTGVVSAATLARGFVGYLSVFIELPSIVALSLLLIAITAVACWGIAESVILAAVITSIEIIGLVIVLYALRGEFTTLPDRLPELLPAFDGSTWVSILLGAFLAFYAFIGFEDMVNVAEEVVDPQRTMPPAIFIALAVASILYALVAVVAVLGLPLSELANSESPMVSLLEQKHHNLALSVGVISLIAVLNGALVQIIMGARMLYGMGHQGLAPFWLANIARRTQTPVRATILIALTIWLLAVGFPLVTLAKLTSFIIIVVFTLVNLSLLAISLREKKAGRLLVANILIPIVAALLCAGLLSLQLYTVLKA